MAVSPLLAVVWPSRVGRAAGFGAAYAGTVVPVSMPHYKKHVHNAQYRPGRGAEPAIPRRSRRRNLRVVRGAEIRHVDAMPATAWRPCSPYNSIRPQPGRSFRAAAPCEAAPARPDNSLIELDAHSSEQ
jgi:hypothetical protein